MSNWQNFDFEIPKVTDFDIHKSIRDAIVETGLGLDRISLSIAFANTQREYNGNSLEKNKEFKAILDQNAFLIKSGIWMIKDEPNFSIHFTRSENRNAFLDGIHLSLQGLSDNFDQNTLAKLLGLLQKNLGADKVRKDLAEVYGPETVRHLQQRERELSRLEKICTDIVNRTTNQIDEYRAKLDDAFEKREDKLLEKFEAKDAELLKREEEVAARIAEIDDRDSRHVRREIRKELKEQFSQRSEEFKLTDGTSKLRGPVYRFTVVLLLFLGFGMVATFFVQYGSVLLGRGTSSSTEVDWILIGRQAILALGFGVTAWFFIRWNNSWFDKHAKEEFKLKRMELDFDRASWLVEMALEWQKESEKEIPAGLLDKLSENLFADPDMPSELLHPAEQLAAAILGSSTQAEVDLPGGVKAKLDRKGISKLQSPQKAN